MDWKLEVVVLPVSDIDRALLKALTKADPNHKAKLFAFIGSVLGVPVGEVQARYDKGVSTAIGMAPVPVGEDLTLKRRAPIQAHSRFPFPELTVDPVHRRNYA